MALFSRAQQKSNKKFTSLLILSLFAISGYSVTYYTCATSGQNTTNSNGTSGCAASTAWNASGNELIVRNTTTFTLTANTTLTGNLTVDAGGILTTSANNRVLTVSNGAILTVNGTIDFGNKNNCQIIVESGGAIIIGATGAVLNNGSNAQSIITVESGASATINGTISATGPITINADVTFEDNLKVSAVQTISGTGNITVKRNFTQSGWVRMGFPVTTGTCGDLVTNGFTLNYSGAAANVKSWQADQNLASPSQWVTPTAGTSLVGRAFLFFVSNGNSISITRPVGGFNNTNLAQPVRYHDGIGGSFVDGVIDGWNQFYNPFQAFIDWNNVTASLTSSGNFNGTAVYVWNGSSYTSWNTAGSSSAQWIAPHQAFFLRALSTASGDFTFTNAMRTTSPGTPVSTFKTNTAGYNVVLTIDGQGKSNRTEIVLNQDATTGFDNNFDAYYLSANPDVPAFYSTDALGVRYSLNQLPNAANQVINLGFTHAQNSKQFTISLDQTLASAISFVTLEDTYAQTLTDLKNWNYSFMSNDAAPAQRFKLHFSQSSIGIAELENGSNFKVWINNNELRFDENENLEGAIINVYSTNGQLIASGTTVNPIYVEKAGVYVVNVLTKKGRTYNVKVVKM